MMDQLQQRRIDRTLAYAFDQVAFSFRHCLSGLKKARISWTSASGCSRAAKWSRKAGGPAAGGGGPKGWWWSVPRPRGRGLGPSPPQAPPPPPALYNEGTSLKSHKDHPLWYRCLGDSR